MFDDLDDPFPPFAGAAALAAVSARASRLRRRRLLVVTASGVAAGLLVLSTAAALATGGPGRASLSAPQTPTATATPSGAVATVGPTASPSPGPEPTASASPRPPVTDPSPCVEPATGSTSCPDGRPGWSTGTVSCTQAAAPSAGADTPPLPGVRLALVLPAAVGRGQVLHGDLTLTNGSDRALQLEVPAPRDSDGLEGGLLGAVGRSAVHRGLDDGVAGLALFLRPGESASFSAQVTASSCGDGAADPDVPLAPGEYRFVLEVRYLFAKEVPSGSPTASAPAGTASPQPSATAAPVREIGRWTFSRAVTVR